MLPVVRARLLTAVTFFADARLSTHSPVRKIFCVVCDAAASPITQRQPSQKMDDIGAKLKDPSGLAVPIKTTGVPKYRMLGSEITCMCIDL